MAGSAPSVPSAVPTGGAGEPTRRLRDVQRAEVLDVVRTTAAELLDVDPATLQDATRFVEDLAVDSLALVEYAMALEDAMDVHLGEEELADLTTVGQLVDLLVRKRQDAA